MSNATLERAAILGIAGLWVCGWALAVFELVQRAGA